MSQIQNRFEMGYFQNYGYQKQLQRLILDSRCASQSSLFSYVQFCKQELKMLNFQVTCAQKFQTKNNFFALSANMECCY